MDDSDKLQVYLEAPFGSQVWSMLDSLDEHYRQEYWNQINPLYCQNINEAEDAVRYLLSANRPQTAFSYLSSKLEQISPEVIFEILQAMLLSTETNVNNPFDSYLLGIAFSHISNCQTLSLEEKAKLEFHYIQALAPYGRKSVNCSINSLERYLEEHPEFIVKLISKLHKRDDGVEDENEAINTQLARSYLYTLEALSHIPGEDNSGKIDTEKLELWLNRVISLAEKNGRRNMAEYYIGKLLGHCQNGEDGIWPCEGVRDLVEDIHSLKMIEGMYIEKLNSRGVTSRSFSEGGAQEWTIAEQYQSWSRKLAISHNFVATKLLSNLAKTYQVEAKMSDTESRLLKHLR